MAACVCFCVAADGSLHFEHPISQQHLLVWKSRPKCVMVLKKLGEELMEEYISVLRFLGEDQGLRILVEPNDFAELESQDGCVESKMPYLDTWGRDDVSVLHQHVDFIVCLGGDGLMLHATHLFGNAIPPIISFKLGSLGFLTCHDFVDAREHLDAVINGSEEFDTCRLTNSVDGSPLMGVPITLRMRLLCELYRNGRRVPGASHEVLNEVVISRGSAPYLSNIEVYERDSYITKVQADGVMLATPTGSTAYSVAAGGSMVHPNVPAILFTPICPHSLSFRPVILPDYAQLELKIARDARSGALATFDGKFTTDLQPGDAVRVTMSPHPVPTINHEDQTIDWFNSIERCFKWNERLEQKKMEPHALKQQKNDSAQSNGKAVANKAQLSARLMSTGENAPGSVPS
jgi:NAD+ kinase